MADPAPYDITINAGATFKLEFEWQEETAPGSGMWVPISFDGYGARMEIRKKKRPDAELMLSIGSDTGEIILNAPDPETGVPRPGVGFIRIPATMTELVTRSGFYDLEIYDLNDDTEVERLMEGAATLSAEVTQP